MSDRDTLYVMPAAGLLVRDPVTMEYLPEVGKRVSRTAYWLRRLADKDVLEIPDPREPKSAAAKADSTPAH